MTEYETTVVLRPDIGGDAVEATLDRIREVIRTGAGKLLAISHWGKKKLAYEIAKHPRGIYVHNHFLANNVLVHELERILRINDNVMRYMTIRIAEKVDPAGREETTYERPQYEAEEAAAAAREAEEEARELEREQREQRGDRDRGDRGDRDRGDRDRGDRGDRDRGERNDRGERGEGRPDRDRPAPMAAAGATGPAAAPSETNETAGPAREEG